MTREDEIKVLMKDRCTKKEAEDALKRGSIVYPDFEENLELYLADAEEMIDKEYAESLRRMVETKTEICDWSIIEMDGKRYYIQYVN